jgi:glycosyltransferase involved in cell wall biosynthesis
VKPIVSLFIPAYNAASTIGRVIDRIPADLWRIIKNVWIINDGSTDATARVIDDLSALHPAIRPVHLTRNKGYGSAVRNGISLCKRDGCDFAACVHADGQYPPESILSFVEAMAARRIDLMQGSRIASGTALRGGMPLYKFIAGKVLTALENRIFGLLLTDYHSGFLVYNRKALIALPFHRLSTSFDFDLEAVASARAAGMTIGELPIPTRYAGEKSYLNPVTYGLRVLWVLVKYKSGYYGKQTTNPHHRRDRGHGRRSGGAAPGTRV